MLASPKSHSGITGTSSLTAHNRTGFAVGDCTGYAGSSDFAHCSGFGPRRKRMFPEISRSLCGVIFDLSRIHPFVVATVCAAGVIITSQAMVLDARLASNSMNASGQKYGRRNASAVCALLATAMAGCATALPDKPAALPVAVEPVVESHRAVQSVRLEPSQIDGQTSWIIEPDVPRIPKLRGVDRRLPPHIEQRLSRAFDLAQRGATYSANSEFRDVISLCALEMDSREGTTRHRDAMRQGLVALDEADELSGQGIDWSDATDVRRATAGHSTPALRGQVPTGVDAIQVVQLYYSYAEERFAFACQGLPGASVAYYGWARTYVQPGARYPHAAGKAAMLQRVALRVAPQNVLAGNELGVLLAQHGHLDEAESLFKQCVATDATPEAWQNLAAVYAQKGDAAASRAAITESSKLAASQKAIQTSVNGVSNEVATSSGIPTDSVAQTETKQEMNAAPGAHQKLRERGGIWKKLELSHKFPNMFQR
jgi:hypothetical protein